MEVSARDALTVTAPKGLIVVNNRVRVRRVAWVTDPRHLTCPDGHRVREHFARIGEDGILWCTYKGNGGKECGAMLWLLLVPQRGLRRLWYAADVTAHEMHEWEARHLDIPDILKYLGVTFPNAA